MPQGYYTIEQWTPDEAPASQWRSVMHLPFGASLTEAEEALQKHGNEGFYRIVQTQRVIWAEFQPDGLKLRKSHADSPKSLESMRAMFERSSGRFPIEEVRAARKRQKAAAGKKAGR
jgi:hypothetical protein